MLMNDGIFFCQILLDDSIEKCKENPVYNHVQPRPFIATRNSTSRKNKNPVPCQKKKKVKKNSAITDDDDDVVEITNIISTGSSKVINTESKISIPESSKIFSTESTSTINTDSTSIINKASASNESTSTLDRSSLLSVGGEINSIAYEDSYNTKFDKKIDDVISFPSISEICNSNSMISDDLVSNIVDYESDSELSPNGRLWTYLIAIGSSEPTSSVEDITTKIGLYRH